MGRNVRKLLFVLLVVFLHKPFQHTFIICRHFRHPVIFEEQEIFVALNAEWSYVAPILQHSLQRLVDFLTHGNLPYAFLGLGRFHIVADVGITQELMVNIDLAVFEVQSRGKTAEL